MLKLGPKARRRKKKDEIVTNLLDQVALTKAADTIVGDGSGGKVRGISGGERKRLSIAVEMIDSPSLVILDEPTTGLDSTAAAQMVHTLRNLANQQNKTIIAGIHQPSQSVFRKFDDLLLISEGKQMYFGQVQNVRSYMEQMGYPAQEGIGTAEHVLNCISQHIMDDNETKEQALARVDKLARVAVAGHHHHQVLDLGDNMVMDDQQQEQQNKKIMENGTVTTAETTIQQQQQLSSNKELLLSQNNVRRPKSDSWTQFRLLFHRSFREITRGKTAILVMLTRQITVALIHGTIYSRLGTNQASIQDRFGLITLVATGSFSMALGAAIRAFPKEKAIVSQELASHMYRTLPYFIGKAMSELPVTGLCTTIFGVILSKMTGLSSGVGVGGGKFERFLGLLWLHSLASEAIGLLIGAMSPNTDVALAIYPAIIILNIVFDGKNVSKENTPYFLRWVRLKNFVLFLVRPYTHIHTLECRLSFSDHFSCFTHTLCTDSEPQFDPLEL